MRWSVSIFLLVFTLISCSGGKTPSGVDPCYRTQAREYQRAAVMLKDSIQTHVPIMVRSTADMLEASSQRDTAGLQAAYGNFSNASDEFLSDGDDFATQMEFAEDTCP